LVPICTRLRWCFLFLLGTPGRGLVLDAQATKGAASLDGNGDRRYSGDC
jgi:hypothetical protein